MKRKKIMKSLLVAAAIGLAFTACKKKSDTTPAIDDAAQQALSASDQSRVETESNQSLDEANAALDGISSTRSATSFPCNATVDSSAKAAGLIKLHYNGNNCANTKSRTGEIDIQLPYNSSTNTVTRWSVAGSSITLTYINFKVTYLSDNKSLTFNGTHSVTNVNGGRLINITAGNPIVHKVRANMQLTFDDGTQRTWSAARTRTFSIANNIISTQITGDTTINSYTNVSMWGINRAGESFVISITTPVVENILGGTCLYEPLSGVRVHRKITRELTVTYGVDASGNPVATGTCPYGFRLNWTNAQGVAKQVIRQY